MKAAVFAAAAAFLVGAAYPASAQAPLAEDPFARGVDLRRAGRAAEAVPLLEAASRARPDDADVWLNLGLAYSATDRLADAERALSQAQRLSPDYPDVQLARARVAFFRGDRAEASRRLAPLLGKNNAEAEALAQQIRAARAEAHDTRWRLDLTASRGDRTNGLPGTRAGLASLSRTRGETTLTGSVEAVRQFGRTDTYVEGVLAGRRAYVAVGGAPSADFRPKHALRLGVTSSAWDVGGWTATLGGDLGYARYPTGEVWSLHPALTLAKGEGVTLTARWINVLDEDDDYISGYALRGVWRAAPRVALSAGWSDAPESSEGRTARVEAASLGVAYDVTADVTLRLDGVREHRAAYDHDLLSVGVTRRF